MRNFNSRFQCAIVLALAASLVSPVWAEEGAGDSLAPPATSEISNESAPADTAADAPMPSEGMNAGGSLDSEPAVEEAPAKPTKKKKAKKVAKKKDKKKKVAKKTAKKKDKKNKKKRRHG